MAEHGPRRIPRSKHEQRALRRHGEAREDRVGGRSGEAERGGKALARQAPGEWHQPPEPPAGADRQHREQRDMHPGDRNQVGRAGGIEHAPLFARHVAGMSDGERPDQRGGVAVVNACRDPLGDSSAELRQRCGARREPFIQA
jgi:hypothetical protein